VALSDSGKVLVVNAEGGVGNTFVYTYKNGQYVLTAGPLAPFNAASGFTANKVAISGDGKTIAIGALSENNQTGLGRYGCIGGRFWRKAL
jgi:hypothetical protein